MSHSQPNTTIKWSQKVAVWCLAASRGLWLDFRTFRGLNGRYRRRINAAFADDWCWRAEAEGEAIAGDGPYLTQGAAEY